MPKLHAYFLTLFRIMPYPTSFMPDLNAIEQRLGECKSLCGRPIAADSVHLPSTIQWDNRLQSPPSYVSKRHLQGLSTYEFLLFKASVEEGGKGVSAVAIMVAFNGGLPVVRGTVVGVSE